MAGISPTRRSSRARITQSQSQVSSTASSSSGRIERATRGFTKTGSPQKSTGSGSLSSEPPEDSTTTEDTVLRRRSTRGKDDDREKQPKLEITGMPPAPDEIQEDDESVRCICGHDEYPGPPPFDEDSKHGVKDAIDHERIFAIEITDELAGFFVQCEICNTWQHGACVGFTTEESNPEDVEYYCEQCRKDLHKIYTASNGQKYSIFLPIHRPSRSASRATSAAKEDARSPKSGNSKSSRASAAAQHASKRRSTMNSRDAAYDEEEQLRRAIEASKTETIPEDADLANRRPKRGREESEENMENVKRQRTNSKSPSPALEKPDVSMLEESDDELGLRNGHSKKSRNAVRNQRERAEREERREEQERKRAEAASKRKGRAERRRADDSDPSEEMPLSTRAVVNRTTESAQPPDPPVPSSQPLPDTPPVPAAQMATGKKKSTQPKKKGRNQYTKDRDNDHEDSPARSVPRDVSRNADEGGANAKNTSHETAGKQSRARGGVSSKITMSDMKRRVNGILEFITRKQVELVNDPLSDSTSGSSRAGTEDGSISTTKVNGGSSLTKPNRGAQTTDGGGSSELADPTAAFKDMSCVEMMDSLTRELMKWQQEFIH
ncbi:putative phd-finger domain-containing protein [Rosellinia necatrix]|uniref:Putative phd-finger domain-containing protein n=1 Tax=Rosellinia necatrix TaxID=77044 RepID=A0A1W2TTD1_ROSNE|nr:putative phd-finger domain-containing protein [Rosellinia necatrix]